jgi:hypothetical protein
MRPWSKWKISQAQKYRNNRYFLPVSIFFVKTLVSIVFGIGIGPSLYKYLFFTISANLHYVDLIWPSGCESNPRPLGYHALEQTWPRSSVGRAAIGPVGLSKSVDIHSENIKKHYFIFQTTIVILQLLTQPCQLFLWEEAGENPRLLAER